MKRVLLILLALSFLIPARPMPKDVLYPLQQFVNALSWTHSPAYRSSNALVTAWTDTPITNYPEVWLMEDIMRVAGGGPNGEACMRANPDWTKAWASGLGIGGFGPETRGQFDLMPNGSGSFTIEWDQEFRKDYYDDNGFGQVIFIGQDFDHSEDGAVDFGSDAIRLDMNQTTGYSFSWNPRMRFVPDYGSNNFGSNYGNNIAATFSVNDQWKTLKLVVVPSTVTGAFVIPGPHPASSTVGADGSITLYSKDSTADDSTYVQEFSLTGLTYVINAYETVAGHTTWARGISFGEATIVGGFTNVEVYYGSADVAVPPMQRASYLLFSRDIIEKQIETRLTRTYYQLLVTDPPASAAPASLGLVTITGSIYNQQGAKFTTGRLYLTPSDEIQVGGLHLVAPVTTTYDVPGTGNLSFQLAPSNGVKYVVEFDPTPSDTSTPKSLKSGYFKAKWTVPATGPVDISTL